MDRTLRAALLRPRHLLATLAVTALLGGFGGLVVGAADATYHAIAPFTVPWPHAGDRVRYLAAGGDAQYASIEAEWLSDQQELDAGGRPAWANVVAVRATLADPATPPRETELALVPGTARVVATVQVSASNSTRDGIHSSEVQATARFDGTRFQLPCGLVTPLQGRAVARTGTAFPEDWACLQGDGGRRGTNRTLEVVGLEQANGTTYLHAAVVDRYVGGAIPFPLPERIVDADLWFEGGIPYPVRFTNGDRSYALAGYTPGAGEVRHAEEVAPGEPVRLALAPATATGPDASGVQHTFPLAEAYDRARNDPQQAGLRDFLSGHPGAYLAEASYRNLVSNGQDGTWDYWYFTVSDGHQSLAGIERRILPRHNLTAGPATVPIPALPPAVDALHPAATYDLSLYAVQDDGGEHPSQPLAQMPTVASLWAAWSRLATGPFAGKAPNAWSFAVRCLATNCTRAFATYGGGYTWYSRTYPGASPTTPADAETISTLRWTDGAGNTLDRPSDYTTSGVEWTRGSDAADAHPAATGLRPGGYTILLGVVGWVAPTPLEAATVGFGSLLLGLLYFVWPAAKAGGVGLFSRVGGDRLLDNPTRALLHQAIEARPGIHHQELVRTAGKGNGAVEHHLRKLERGGLVSRVQGQGYTCYFVKGAVDRRAMAAAPLLKSPVAQAIVAAARSRPGLSPSALARELGVAPPTISYHLRRLEAAGLVRLADGLRVPAGAA